MAEKTVFHLESCPTNKTGSVTDCSCNEETAHYLKLAKLVFIVSLSEIIGGKLSGSTAMISEGFHQLFDGMESIVNFFVSILARRSKDEKRVRFVGGEISAALLLCIAIWIIFEGIGRIQNPQPISPYMILIALFGFVVTVLLRIIHQGARKEHINLSHLWQDRHLVSDLLANGAVVIGGVIMAILGEYYWIDGILSVGIGTLILFLTGARLVGIELHSHEHGAKCNHKH